jgi:hypothetical protein
MLLQALRNPGLIYRLRIHVVGDVPMADLDFYNMLVQLIPTTAYLPTYLPLPTYLLTCLPTYLPTYLPAYLLTYLPTHPPTVR